jgi:phosphoglycolate phosphatase
MFRSFRPLPAGSLRLLVFDLDGTLIDSGADLSASVNAMLRHYGRPVLPQEIIATYIGDGVAKLVSRALGEPEDCDFLESAIKYFLDYYREHKLDHTYVYPGVFESLESLRPRSMAVLTNKPIGPSQAICDGLGLTPYFFAFTAVTALLAKSQTPKACRR